MNQYGFYCRPLELVLKIEYNNDSLLTDSRVAFGVALTNSYIQKLALFG